MVNAITFGPIKSFQVVATAHASVRKNIVRVAIVPALATPKSYEPPDSLDLAVGGISSGGDRPEEGSPDSLTARVVGIERVVCPPQEDLGSDGLGAVLDVGSGLFLLALSLVPCLWSIGPLVRIIGHVVAAHGRVGIASSDLDTSSSGVALVLGSSTGSLTLPLSTSFTATLVTIPPTAAQNLHYILQLHI